MHQARPETKDKPLTSANTNCSGEIGHSDDPVSNNTGARLQALHVMDRVDLQAEWRRLYRIDPPIRMSRELLMLGVGWKMQERTHGGLRKAINRRLVDLAKALEHDSGGSHRRVVHLRPGARLVREWGGQSHTIIVREDGFEWKGQLWRSLSAIAREITGAHWSGPRFFGIGVDKARSNA